jgi:hypothetical protein
MSLTVFLALCVLGVDFLIYFFFKLLYGEKYRIRSRRLPLDYYRRKEPTSSLYLVPARRGQPGEAVRSIPMPKSAAKRTPHDRALRGDFSERSPHLRGPLSTW